MDFANKNLWLFFEINGEGYYITQTHLSTWIVMAILAGLAVVVRIRLKSFKGVPKGFQNVIETLVETMSNLVKSTMGESMNYEWYGAYFFSVFGFILLSNYIGLFTLRPPTADLATTAALGIATFLLIHGAGIAYRKSKYLTDFLSPNPIFLPLNLIGEISKPISLSFRLFGNILGGIIIMGLIYQMLPLVLRFAFPAVLHVYFDIFVGALQTYIFTVLSITFIHQKATGL